MRGGAAGNGGGAQGEGEDHVGSGGGVVEVERAVLTRRGESLLLEWVTGPLEHVRFDSYNSTHTPAHFPTLPHNKHKTNKQGRSEVPGGNDVARQSVCHGAFATLDVWKEALSILTSGKVDEAVGRLSPEEILQLSFLVLPKQKL